jgi:hypothetical protein
MRNAPQTQYLPIDEVKPYAPHLRLHRSGGNSRRFCVTMAR